MPESPDRRLDTAPKTLEMLPLEILEHICSFLPRSGLGELRRICPKLCDAANHHMWRTICIVPVPREGVEDCVHEFRAILQRQNSMRHVRTFEIQRLPWNIGQNQSLVNGLWDILVTFLVDLPSLSDLICGVQVGQALFNMLYEDNTRCKLHLRGDDITVSPSPALRRIHTIVPFRCDLLGGKESTPRWNSILQTLGSAPNLEELCVSSVPSYHEDHHGSEDTTSLKSSECSRLVQTRLSVLATEALLLHDIVLHADLTYLTRLYLQNACEDELLELARFDLKTLHSLDLHVIPYGPNWYLFMKREWNQPANIIELSLSTQAFIRKLPPLRDLRLSGPFTSLITDDVLDYHRQSLKRLRIEPCQDEVFGWESQVFEADLLFIKRIQNECCKLEELQIQIRRTLGDREEVSLYKALGAARTIRSLSLLLDCSYKAGMNKALESDIEDALLRQAYENGLNPSVLQPGQLNLRGLSISENVLAQAKSEVTNALINFTIDQDLARSIFMKIFNSDPYNTHLKRISLTVIDAGQNRSDDRVPRFWNIFDEMQKDWPQWSASRSSQVINIQPLKADLNWRPRWEGEFPCFRFIVPIFHEIWPNARPGYWADRTSFPLDDESV